MRLIITRHGRTIENDAGIIQGHLPGHLNEKGIKQAQKVSERLKDENIDIIYSSDLDRAAATAEEIRKHHLHVPIILLECLRESYLGEWQGRTKTELGFHLVENPDDLMPKDGESYDSMRKRASEFIYSLLPKHSKDTVLLVGHAGINRFLTEAVLGESVTTAFGNTSVSIYEVADDFAVKTEVFNCMKHLED